MSSTAIATIEQMLEALPAPLQEQAVQHLREYIADLYDELQWQALYDSSQPGLAEAARRAKAEIAEGKAVPLQYGKL